jgi:glycosyltransferase involved in cell wall biosynthesis
MLKISVIVPVYNVEEYLAECLDSLLKQEIKEIEIICVEDKSTDRSLDILKEYAEKNEQIKIVENEKNSGLAFTRNRGIRYAKGKYIIFVDSDDILVENALKELYEYAELNELEGVVFKLLSMIEHDSDNIEYISEDASDEINGTICDGKSLFVQFSKDLWWRVGSPHYFWRRDFIVDNDLFFLDGMIYEDVMHTFKCLMRTKRIGNRNIEYYIYRRRNRSIMGKMEYRYVESRFLIFNELYSYWRAHSEDEVLGEAIRVYLERTIKLFTKEKSYFPEYEPLSLGNSADKFLFELIYRYGDKSNQDGYSKKFLDRLKNQDGVVLYGAGIIGKRFADHFRLKYWENVIGFAVSDIEGQEQKVCGLPVYAIEELLKYKEKANIFITTGPNLHKEIMENLLQKGFRNIYPVEWKKLMKSSWI